MATEQVSYALAMSRRRREPTSSQERIRLSSIVEVPAGPVMRYGPMRRQRVMKELAGFASASDAVSDRLAETTIGG